MKKEKLACTFSVITILIFSIVMLGVEATPQQPKIFVDPKVYIATQLDEVFTININITNAQNFIGFEFKLGYNTTLLDALGAVEGNLPQPPISRLTRIYDSEGYIWVSIRCGPTLGNGTLAVITLKATYAESSSCTLNLYDTELINTYGDPIPHETEGGTYKFMRARITVVTDKPLYSLGENVQIYGNLTLGNSSLPGLIALQVIDQTTYPLVIKTLKTGPAPPANISIVEVIPCGDIWGTPRESFYVGTTAYFKVTVTNNDVVSRDVTVTLNVYDSDVTPFGTRAVPKHLAPSASTSDVLSIEIPEWASIGNGTIYANAYTDWPGPGPGEDRPRNGIPYCPEESATFQIIGGSQGTPETPTSEVSGNYNLTFKLPPNARSGLYRVYAVSSYKKQLIKNSIVFGVNTICVPDHYPTIQEAVDAATSTNNTIMVCPGTYNEHVTINKPLTLVGRNPSNTVINGGGTGTVITVTADNVEISRFTIKSGGSLPYSGIALNNSSGCIISENIITSNNGYGIYINQSTNNVLRDNTLTNNNFSFGVFGDSISDFIHDVDTSNIVNGKPIYYWINQQKRTVPSDAGFAAVVNSTEIVVRDLNLKENFQGVLFAFTNNSLIERVNILNNEYGLHLYHSYDNIIVGSLISNNSVGIYQAYSNGSIICHNNFIDNTKQVELHQSSNTWNDATGKGNYWSDYAGEDLDGDGVGDTLLPHLGVDIHPLMEPWIPVHDAAITSVTFLTPFNTTDAYPGWKINIFVSLRNEGDFTENFNITIYYDGNTIGTKTLAGTFPQKIIAENLTWNTEEVSPGNYTIWAQASIALNEIDTLVDGTIRVRVWGDVNGNGVVDLGDVAKLDLIYSEIIKPPYQTLLPDINGNGRVDFGDVAKLDLIYSGVL